MKTTAELFASYQIKNVPDKRDVRESLIVYFADKMNPLRKEAGYRQLSPISWRTILAVFDVEQLVGLKDVCEKAKNFGSTFNHFVFAKKE